MKDQNNIAYEETLGLTSQDAVEAVGNRYDLVLIGSRRVRELGRGDAPKVAGKKRGPVLTALREIEAGKVGREYLYKNQDVDSRRRSRD